MLNALVLILWMTKTHIKKNIVSEDGRHLYIYVRTDDFFNSSTEESSEGSSLHDAQYLVEREGILKMKSNSEDMLK